MPQKYPKSLQVIGIILLAAASMSIIALIFSAFFIDYESYGIPKNTNLYQGILGSVITFAAGIGIFKRWNFTRYLYIGATIFFSGLAIMQAGLQPFNLLNLAFTGVIVYFLFGAKANEYFKGTWQPAQLSPEVDPASLPVIVQVSTTRKVFAIISAIFGSFFLLSLFMMFIPFLKDFEQEGKAALLIYVVMAFVFLVPAVFFWGITRLRIFLGVIFTTLGGFLALTVVSLLTIRATPELLPGYNTKIAGLLHHITISSGVFGVIALTVGIWMIQMQRYLDKR